MKLHNAMKSIKLIKTIITINIMIAVDIFINLVKSDRNQDHS